MSDRGENREQPSIPEPAQLSVEHVALAGARAELREVREALRQRQVAVRQVRESVGVGRPHRSSRGGDRSEYWTVYADVLEDLGGLDRPPSEG